MASLSFFNQQRNTLIRYGSIFRPSVQATRRFCVTAHRLQMPKKMPVTAKPVGAFRGGLIGFLLGTSLGAYGSYFYLFDDYHRSNDMLNEDMYALQVAVTRLTNYVTSLEEKVDKVGRGR